MLEQLKKIFKLSKEAVVYTYLFVYLIILVGLVFAIVGALTMNGFLDKPYYIIAIVFLGVGFVNNFAITYFFSSKTKSIIKKLPALKQDFLDLFKNVYIWPLYCWNRLIKSVNIVLEATTDEELLDEVMKKNNNEKALLVSERLKIRHFIDQDLDFVFHYRNDKNVNFYQTYDAFTKKEIKDMFEKNKNKNLLSDVGLFAIALKDSNQIIGEIFTSYKPKENQYFIGFTISPEFQRKGYAYEIVSELIVDIVMKINKIKFICTVYENNIKSTNLIKKLEFTNTGNFFGEKGKILVFEKTYN